MAGYHEALQQAGVPLDGSGPKPSAEGWRIHYGSDGQRRVVDGPFAKTRELVAGYTLIRVRSRDEAMAWTRRFSRRQWARASRRRSKCGRCTRAATLR